MRRQEGREGGRKQGIKVTRWGFKGGSIVKLMTVGSVSCFLLSLPKWFSHEKWLHIHNKGQIWNQFQFGSETSCCLSCCCLSVSDLFISSCIVSSSLPLSPSLVSSPLLSSLFLFLFYFSDFWSSPLVSIPFSSSFVFILLLTFYLNWSSSVLLSGFCLFWLVLSVPFSLLPPACGALVLQVANQSAVSQEQVDNILQENDALRTNLAALEQVMNQENIIQKVLTQSAQWSLTAIRCLVYLKNVT